MEISHPSNKQPKELTLHERHSASRRWLRIFGLIILVMILMVFTARSVYDRASAANPPTVNGQFWGDGDYARYWDYAETDNGSELKVYFDSPTLYGVLVVDRAVNDNVCGDKPYTTDAGWNPGHDCKRLTDSEFATFTVECTTAPQSWTWQQGYAQEIGGTWYSNETISTGSGAGTAPPGYVSSSSWVWNIEHYKINPAPNWDLYDGNGSGAALDLWKSPFDPASPSTVIGLDGYPAAPDPIAYSTYYEWEWPMVYEFSVDLSICGSNIIYVLSGLSHHSPGKHGEEDDPFPPDGDPLADFGDLPDTYSTLLASSGPSHQFVINNGLYLGVERDPEKDGQPVYNASGDDDSSADDEDGVTRGTQQWTNGATVDINLELSGVPATGDVGIWIDWDGSGTFEADEFYSFLDLIVGTTNTVQVVVPDSATYTVGDPLNVRVRLFDDETNAPGGSLDAADYAGAAVNGEVEDYQWYFDPNAVELETLTASSPGLSTTLAGAGVMLVVVLGVGIFTLNKRRKA
jgi:hypothetical protein